MGEKNNNYLRIGELPILRVIPIEELVFHEDPDEQRLLNLVNRLGSEGILKNPPIVAKMNGDRQSVILDGANRVTALLKLGFKHILVQMVKFNDPLLGLLSWHHAIEKLGKDFFVEKIREMLDVRLFDEPIPEINDTLDSETMISNGFLCNLTFDDGQSITIRNNGDIIRQVEILKKITDLYIYSSLSDRVSYTNLKHLKRNYPEFRTLLRFRLFDKDDFSKIVDSGRKLPAGITRVFLPKRALGLNIQLELLRSGLTLEEKNLWLDEMILKKVREKSIRFYKEPTFSFDE